MGLRLYQLSTDFATLSDRLTEDEVPPDLESQIDALNLSIETKVGGCVAVWRTLDAEAEAYRAESGRLAKMAKVRENARDRLKSYVACSLDTAGIGKITTDIGKVSVGNAGRPSIRWAGELADLPTELRKPPAIELDGTKAYEMHKAGSLPDGFAIITARVVRVS